MFARFTSIAFVSFVETIRQPIYGVLLIATALMLVANVSLAGFTLDDDDKLLMDLGLSTLLMSGLFLASFSATGVLTREIENKTVLTVISKPVHRTLFFLAKFSGLALALILAHYLNTLVFILAQRHGVMQTSAMHWDMPVLLFGTGAIVVALTTAAFCNYFYGKDFPITCLMLVTPLLTLAVLGVAFFSPKWELIPFASKYVSGQVLIAAFLVLLINLVLSALALAVSTRLGQLMTLLVCVAFLCLALIADYAFGPPAHDSFLAATAYHLVPNIGPFWVIDALTDKSDKTAIPLRYLFYASGYAFLLVVGFLNVGIAMFQRREVG